MIKKIKSKLAVKVFIISALLMAFCCGITYFFILHFAPYIYSYTPSDVEWFADELAQELSMTDKGETAIYFSIANDTLTGDYNNEYLFHLFNSDGEEVSLTDTATATGKQIDDYNPTYSAYSGTEALLFLEKQKVNLIILDLMLPGLSGEQVLAEIKKTKNVPVIGLSAKEDSKSKIFLLKNGADDYVTKPFDIEELLARIETILRRIYENQYTSNSLLCCGDLNLDTIGMEATLKNQKLPLTKNEFAILKMLMEHPQQVFTKDMIYEQLWNETLEGTENAINVHISNLRKKIAAIDNSKSYIKTVWGIGFKMDI